MQSCILAYGASMRGASPAGISGSAGCELWMGIVIVAAIKCSSPLFSSSEELLPATSQRRIFRGLKAFFLGGSAMMNITYITNASS